MKRGGIAIGATPIINTIMSIMAKKLGVARLRLIWLSPLLDDALVWPFMLYTFIIFPGF
jgi:hypothetical protein